MVNQVTPPRVYSITDPTSLRLIGGAVYCDTSALVHMMDNPVTPDEILAHQEISRFVSDLAQNSVVLCTSSFTSVDLRGALVNRRWRQARELNPGVDKYDIGRRNPSLTGDAIRDVDRILKAIHENDNFLVLSCEVGAAFSGSVDDVMTKHNLGFFDACHYSVMQREGIQDILTTDKGFALVQDPQLRIFTTSTLSAKLNAKLNSPVT